MKLGKHFKYGPLAYKVVPNTFDDELFGEMTVDVATIYKDGHDDIAEIHPQTKYADVYPKLFAAAPDLLAVLQKWATSMENNYSREDISWYDETMEAIRKATA